MATDLEFVRSWRDGQKLYEQRNYQEAAEKFREIQEPNHRILFNIGCAFLHCGQIHRALQAFRQCVERDRNIVIGYFQCGVCYHKQQKYRDAALNWNFALERMHGRKYINYNPIQMKYTLYECEIRHNLALTLMYLSDYAEAGRVLQAAVCLKETPKHEKLITEATEAYKTGSAFPLLEIPANAIFRAKQELVRVLSKKKGLPAQPKVIASYDGDRTLGFTGAKIVEQNDGQIPYIPAKPKKKNPLTRSLENLLDPEKKGPSTVGGPIGDIGAKKGTNIGVAVRKDRIKFLRENVPKRPPPRLRAPLPGAMPAPVKQAKSKILDSQVPLLPPPPKNVRGVNIPDMPSQGAGSSLVPVSENTDTNEHQFVTKWGAFQDNSSRGQAWRNPQDSDSLTNRRTSEPILIGSPQITISFDFGARSQSLIPEDQADDGALYVNLPRRPRSTGASPVGTPDCSDDEIQVSVSPRLQLAGAYAGLDRANIDETDYANLDQAENLYEQVSIRVKTNFGRLGDRMRHSIPATPDEVDYEVADLAIEDTNQDFAQGALFRPIKRGPGRRSLTTDDLPNPRTAKKTPRRGALKKPSRQAPTSPFGSPQSMTCQSPPEPPSPSRPDSPGYLERRVMAGSPQGRSRPTRPAPKLSGEIMGHGNPSSPKQFADRDVQWVKREEHIVTCESDQQGTRRVSVDRTFEGQTSDGAVKVRRSSTMEQKVTMPPLSQRPGGVRDVDAVFTTRRQREMSVCLHNCYESRFAGFLWRRDGVGL